MIPKKVGVSNGTKKRLLTSLVVDDPGDGDGDAPHQLTHHHPPDIRQAHPDVHITLGQVLQE